MVDLGRFGGCLGLLGGPENPNGSRPGTLLLGKRKHSGVGKKNGSGLGKKWSGLGKKWSGVGKKWSGVGKNWSGLGIKEKIAHSMLNGLHVDTKLSYSSISQLHAMGSKRTRETHKTQSACSTCYLKIFHFFSHGFDALFHRSGSRCVLCSLISVSKTRCEIMFALGLLAYGFGDLGNAENVGNRFFFAHFMDLGGSNLGCIFGIILDLVTYPF